MDVDGKRRDPGPGYRTECRHGCGWFRDQNGAACWRNQVMAHLVYGVITCEELAARDISSHDCGEYAAARMRLKTALKAP